ncbi:MAG TPA: branched-chain-amino-acid transaminase [Elusimicrobia bacterium]|nr:MAG: branched-chain-amino-acid transaminase [Elusimicrobia bacterium GWA2_66_18]OGR68940.1 MAG: branched-chain-amino-acid transaminase [Elusimicrobia bacterium GWC2_65_9]HAZ07569.1 branched-chain-amino-acid transaminase [Elusimicrobiota bacterium]
MKIYIDGKFYDKNDAKISVFDHGVLYGDGIFEGIRAYNGRVFRLDDHLQRLEESANAILLKLPMTLKEIETAALETVRLNGLKDAYIRLVVTRGVGDLGLDMRKCRQGASIFIIADKIELYPEEFYEKGLTLVTSTIRQKGLDQVTPGVKSLNYLANILARAEATAAGAQEAILLNATGQVSECSGDNLFYIKGGKIFTPPSSAGILSGVTRQVVMELAESKLGIKVIERNFPRYDLYTADEVFLTGTGAEVIAGVKIDGRVIGSGAAGPMTKKLIKHFREYANSTGTPVYETVKAK